MIQLLLASSPSVDVEDKESATPLLLAVSSGHERAAGVLMDAGASPNVSNSQLEDALWLSLKHSLFQVFQRLLKTTAYTPFLVHRCILEIPDEANAVRLVLKLCSIDINQASGAAKRSAHFLN